MRVTHLLQSAISPLCVSLRCVRRSELYVVDDARRVLLLIGPVPEK